MKNSKKMEMKKEMCSCSHHSWTGWIVLIIGVLYLLQDLSVISWMGWLNWWTVAFILIACASICKCCNKKCF